MEPVITLFFCLLLAGLTLLFGGIAVRIAAGIVTSVRGRGGVHTGWSPKTCAGMAVVCGVCAVFSVLFAVNTVRLFAGERPMYYIAAGLSDKGLLPFVIGALSGAAVVLTVVILRRKKEQ